MFVKNSSKWCTEREQKKKFWNKYKYYAPVVHKKMKKCETQSNMKYVHIIYRLSRTELKLKFSDFKHFIQFDQISIKFVCELRVKIADTAFVSSMRNALIRKRLAPISGNIEMEIFISSETDEKFHYIELKTLLIACVRDASYQWHTLLQRLNSALIKWWYLKEKKEKGKLYPIRWNFSTERYV